MGQVCFPPTEALVGAAKEARQLPSHVAQDSAQLSPEALAGLSVQTTAATLPLRLLLHPSSQAAGPAALGASGLLWQLQPGRGVENPGTDFFLERPKFRGNPLAERRM